MYIIGDISCYEGFKSGTLPGYRETLRQSGPEAVRVYTNLYKTVFENFKFQAIDSVDMELKRVHPEPQARLKVATLLFLEDRLKMFRTLIEKSKPAKSAAKKSKRNRSRKAKQ